MQPVVLKRCWSGESPSRRVGRANRGLGVDLSEAVSVGSAGLLAGWFVSGGRAGGGGCVPWTWALVNGCFFFFFLGSAGLDFIESEARRRASSDSLLR